MFKIPHREDVSFPPVLSVRHLQFWGTPRPCSLQHPSILSSLSIISFLNALDSKVDPFTFGLPGVSESRLLVELLCADCVCVFGAAGVS